MEKYKMKYSLDNAISNITDLNSSFSLGTLKVAYTGVNVNHSSISKEAFELSAPTMFNCPIVANYDMETNQIGGHDEGFIETENGLKYVNLTQPVGVVPESATYHWEQIEDDGVLHDYFCIDGVILWKRQPCYAKLVDNGITSQSIEIHVSKGVLSDNILNIEQFEYEAFCLLERDEPCFEQASLQVFTKDEFKKQWQEMMAEYSASLESIKIGGTQMNTTNTAESEVVVDTVQEEVVIETMPDEVVVDQTEEFKTDTNKQEHVSDSAEKFALTANQKRQALQAAIDAFATEPYCLYVEDFDDSEVYVYDCNSGKLYGYEYVVSDNTVTVDPNSAKEKMITYVNVTDDTVSNSALADVINSIVEASNASLSSGYESQMSELNTQISDLNQQVAELAAFKKEKLASERAAQENELFARFEPQLKNIEEYESLKAEASKYSLDELETKCFASVGRKTYAFSKASTMTTYRVPLDFSKDEDCEAYGGLLKNKTMITEVNK